MEPITHQPTEWWFSPAIWWANYQSMVSCIVAVLKTKYLCKYYTREWTNSFERHTLWSSDYSRWVRTWLDHKNCSIHSIIYARILWHPLLTHSSNDGDILWNHIISAYKAWILNSHFENPATESIIYSIMLRLDLSDHNNQESTDLCEMPVKAYR